MMDIEYLIFVLGAALLVATTVFLVIHRTQRRRLFRGFKHNSLHPSKRLPSDLDSGKHTPPPPYKDILPPLRREALGYISEKWESTKLSLPAQDFDESDVLQHILPMTEDYRVSAGLKFTPTGFTTEEIKALGDFPDYASLSGVPLPEVYYGFNIDEALPRPYRPFRWNYHQTMSLTRMEPDWWLELEHTYKDRIEQRRALYAKYGKLVLDKLPGTELACKELMEIVIQFLCARYPTLFSLSDDKRYLKNNILGVVEDLNAKDPLMVLMDHVPEDFGIMMRDDKTGYYFLRAGVICSSLGWTLGSKLGMQLHEIHQPIPDYKEKMKFSMDRYFAKKLTDKPIQRGSWGLEVENPLFMPQGDPHELHRLSQSPSLELSSCYLRVDWQTLRRLPLSGAIIFNFKGLFTPVSEFRDEPGIPALVAKILKEGKKSIMEYKNTWHVEHVVLPALEQWAAEQQEKGIVQKDWKVATLEESPYFKGWEAKWHRQQGF